jgi:hypothetical protein
MGFRNRLLFGEDPNSSLRGQNDAIDPKWTPRRFGLSAKIQNTSKTGSGGRRLLLQDVLHPEMTDDVRSSALAAG